MDLDGAVAIVTGASRGVGAATAIELARAGARVVCAARATDASPLPIPGTLDDTVRAITELGGTAVPHPTNLAADTEVEGLVDATVERYGGVDVLVNNAAIGKRKLVPTLTDDDLDTTMRTNFTSPVRMAMTLLPAMLARASGLIVNVSSMGGRLGIAHEAAYCASKFALAGWSESARLDLDATGVKVKLVLPGPIATEIWEVRPGELPGMYDGPFVTAADCAADIVAAIEDPDGFEYYTPEQVPGGWSQKDLVVGKTSSCDQFLAERAQMAAGT